MMFRKRATPSPPTPADKWAQIAHAWIASRQAQNEALARVTAAISRTAEDK